MLTRRSLGPHPARIRVGRLPAAYKELLTGAHPADNEEQLAGPQAPRYARQPTKQKGSPSARMGSPKPPLKGTKTKIEPTPFCQGGTAQN